VRSRVYFSRAPPASLPPLALSLLWWIAKRVHVFARKKRKSDFVDKQLNGKTRYSEALKTVTFIAPLTIQQHSQRMQVPKCYSDKRIAPMVQNVLCQLKTMRKLAWTLPGYLFLCMRLEAYLVHLEQC